MKITHLLVISILVMPLQTLFNPLVAQAAPGAVFTWSMEPRYQDSWAAWNSDPAEYAERWVNPKSWAVDSYDPDYVHPKSWKVNFDACKSTSGGNPIDQYNWRIEGAGFSYSFPTSSKPPYASPNCTASFYLPQQGFYRVTLSIQSKGGITLSRTGQIEVKDYLIVSIGDSFQAGEGNPDVPGIYDVTTHQFDEPEVNYAIRLAVWQDRRCHRSAFSGPALAAKALEDADPHTSVTFLSFACSGADIGNLIDNPYKGQEPPAGPVLYCIERPHGGEPQHYCFRSRLVDLPAQISAVVSATISPTRTRQIDALLMTVGVNDLDFRGTINKCARNDNGWVPFSVSALWTDDPTCANVNTQFLTGRYDALGSAIATRLNPVEVYVTDYPNNLLAGGGCEELKTIGPQEGAAIQALGETLSHAIYMAAQKFKWNIVLGAGGNSTITEAFAHHSYCDKARWFVGLNDSANAQGPSSGALHPNRDGHKAIGALLAQAIKLGQTPYAHVVLTVNAVRLSGGDRHVTIEVRGNNFLAMIPQSCSFTAPSIGEYFSDADIDGTNIARPLSKGCRFTLEVGTAPTLQRLATHVHIVASTYQNFVEAYYDQSEGFGIGSHETVGKKVNNIDIAVKYTIDVERLHSQPVVCCY